MTADEACLARPIASPHHRQAHPSGQGDDLGLGRPLAAGGPGGPDPPQHPGVERHLDAAPLHGKADLAPVDHIEGAVRAERGVAAVRLGEPP